jgi:CBS domain-containing protein
VDPRTYIRQLAVLGELPEPVLDQVVDQVEVTYEPAGVRLLAAGGKPSRHLWIVRKGRVELRDGTRPLLELEPGDWFGFHSLLADASPDHDTVVVEDALLYRIPGSVLRDLLVYPQVAAYVTGGLAARLMAGREVTGKVDASVAAATLVSRPPVIVPADASLQYAARRMREAGVSSVVVDTRPRGVITGRDLRDVVADGRPVDIAAARVMTWPMVSLSGEATVEDVLDALLVAAQHHVLLTVDGTPDGEPIGVITTGDMLRHEATNPVHIARLVGRSRQPDDLARTADRLHRLVGSLLDDGHTATPVLRAVTAVNDAATRAALRIAITELGAPAVPYAWLALGSQGRRDQALLTDQDSALVHGEASDDEVTHLAAIVERVVELLELAGLPRCRGGTMATRWRGDTGWWRQRFSSWVGEPDQQALYEAMIFFDLRVVHGELDVAPLHDVIREGAANDVFLARLAAAAAVVRPAIGWFHTLARDSKGRVDLKTGGLTPIIDLARLVALEAGRTEVTTRQRLDVARDAGTVSPEGHDLLVSAFKFLQGLRLRAQYEAIRDGREPTNLVDPQTLPTIQRRHLKEVLVAVADIQRVTLERLGARYVPL